MNTLKTVTIINGKRAKLPFSALVSDGMSDLASWVAAPDGAAHPARLKAVDGASRECLARGDLAGVARSDALLDRIETLTLTDYARPETIRAVCGGVADVPAYLAGQPVAMRRRERREEARPVTVVADISTSGAVSEDQIARRGAATLALVRRLEMAGHPVTLWIGAAMLPDGGSGRTAQLVRIDTQPLDLARAAFALTDARMQRAIAFRCSEALVGGGYGSISWPTTDWCRDLPLQASLWRALLGEGAGDLIHLPAVHRDEASHFVSDAAALKWLTGHYETAVKTLAGE